MWFSPRRNSNTQRQLLPSKRSRRLRHVLRTIEQLELRTLMARDFLELANDSFPGQTVEHFNPSELGVVDSRSTNASITDGDVDDYNFRSSVAGEIVVSLLHQGGNPSGDDTNANADDLVLERLNNAGAVIDGPFTIPNPGGTASVSIPGVALGQQFWFRVRGVDGNDDASYQLVLQNRDREDDAGGNNNSSGSAAPLGTVGSILGSDLTGYSITSPDRDYFSFVVPANTPGDLSINVLMPPGTGAASGVNGPTNLGLRVRDASGMVIASSNATTGSLDSAIINVPNSALALTYFIEVYSGSLGQVNRYDLTILQNPVPVGTLSGFKFNDLNADGLWDENEPGITGVTVNLDLNNDATVDATTTTGAGGAVLVCQRAAGNASNYGNNPREQFSELSGASGNFGYVININPNDLVLDHLDFGNFQLDFGDSPDPTFSTLIASNGARHVFNATGLRLEAQIDAEADGQPNATATGDDAAGVDDEDGIAFTNTWVRGQNATLDVTSSGFGLVSAWADFNGNGSWADPGEQFFTNMAVVPGVNPLAFLVPAGASLTNANVRFRLSSAPGLSFSGLALDGEVEDYQRQIFDPATIDFLTTTSSVAEGNVQTVTLRLNLPAGTLANNVTVNVQDLLTGTAISATDYTALANPTQVTFPAGSAGGTLLTFNVTTTDDLLAELDETINTQITSITGSGGQVAIGANNTHQVTITDAADRAQVSVRFQNATSTVPESNTGHNVNVELVTTGGITLGVAITAQVTDAAGGTATSGTDYTAVGTQIVTFGAGSGNGATQPATVAILDDTVAEPDETVNLALSAGTPFGTLGSPASHQVTITDASDRSNVTVQFDTAASAVGEANVGFPVTLRLVMTGGITSIGRT